MALLRIGDVMPDGRGIPVEGGERREHLGAVALDGEQIVGAVRLDDRPLGVSGGVQGVQGDQAAAHIDILQQRPGRGDLAPLVAAAAAREGMAGVGHQRHRLEMGVVARMAVGAADALAIRRERRGVRRLGKPRRRPLAEHLRQGVRVGVRHHPADRRVRRRHPAARDRIAPSAQRAQLLLVEPLREPFRRHRPTQPRQPRQRANGQNRLQPVLPALAAAAVRHRREQLPQRAQLLARVRYLGRAAGPLRAVRRVRQTGSRVRAQRAHEHLLEHLVRVRVGAVVAREALGAAHPQPVRGIVGAAVKARRIHERLGQLQRMTVRRLPVRAQAPQAAPSTREARFAIPAASGRIKNRVLLPIRCKRRNCTDRCQPSQRSRGAHLNAPDCQPNSASQCPHHTAT